MRVPPGKRFPFEQYITRQAAHQSSAQLQRFNRQRNSGTVSTIYFEIYIPKSNFEHPIRPRTITFVVPDRGVFAVSLRCPNLRRTNVADQLILDGRCRV
jgi:hypothetical protein